MQQWHDYAERAITPNFSWANLPQEVAAPTVFDRAFGRRSVSATVALNRESSLSLDIRSHLVGEHGANVNAANENELLPLAQFGLQRTLFTPAYSRMLGEQGHWSVGAVFAYQRFATFGLGAVSNSTENTASVLPGAEEVSYGRGVRVDATNALNEHLRWSVGYQSRVNMDTFNRFRGVYADPGDFDIPASASFGLGLGRRDGFALDLGVERVMYSDIRPFTSAALPRRFLALLGDSTSPVFAWRDLTVYSLTGSVHDDELGDLSLRYSSREQPSPTSNLLARLLDEGQSNHSVELRYARATGPNSRFQLLASYTPYQYVLGAPTSYSVRNDVHGNQVEYEALWSLAF